jgi:hypothetical protein
MGSFDPMVFRRRKNGVLTPPFIVSMSPPGYPSAWLRPRSARFRFARQIIVARNDLPFLNIRFGALRQQLGPHSNKRMELVFLDHCYRARCVT